MSRTLWRADNQAWGTSEMVRLGKKFQCIYGLGRTDYETCAARCRDHNKTCFRSGSACSKGAYAMTMVVQ
jgi:hypothetical protein